MIFRNLLPGLLGAALLLGCGGGSQSPAVAPAPSPSPEPAAAPPAVAAAAAASAPAPHADVTIEGNLLPPMPRAVTSFGAAAAGGSIYVLGGYFGTPHDYSHEYQSAAFARVPLSGEGAWERLPPVDTALQGLALVAHEGKLYRVGGMKAENTSDDPPHMVSVTEFARFDPERGEWESLAPLPEGRSSHDAVVIGNALYVAGGWRLDGHHAEARWHRNVLVADLDRDPIEWRELPAPFARRGVAVASLAGRLAVIGGMEEDGTFSQRVDLYDPRTGEWQRGPRFPGVGFGAAAAEVGSAIVASGADGSLFRLRKGDRVWTEIGVVAVPRLFHRIVPRSAKEIVVLGGIGDRDDQSRVSLVEVIDVSGRAERPRLSIVSLPNPSRAKNRQGLFLRGQTVYVFGGNTSLEQHDFAAENFLAEGHALHLPSLTWSEMPAYPVRRQTMSTVVSPDEKLGFAMGGFGHDGESAKSHPEVFVFDFESGTWSQRPAGLPTRRTQFGAAVQAGKIWVFGGLDFDDSRDKSDHFRHLTQVVAAPLDRPEAPFEEMRAPLPSARRAFGSALLGDRFYVVGGMEEGFRFLDDAVVFDMKTRKWKPIAKPRRGRLSAEVVALGGKLYLAGGSVKNGGEIVNERSIEVYDPRRNQWQTLLELPFDTTHAQMRAFGKRLLLYSAHQEDPRVRVVLIDVD